jgi:hypothetical protein
MLMLLSIHSDISSGRFVDVLCRSRKVELTSDSSVSWLRESTLVITMKSFSAALLLQLGALSTMVAATSVNAKRSVAEVSVQGNAFFAGTNRFYIRGVDYQPGEFEGSLE